MFRGKILWKNKIKSVRTEKQSTKAGKRLVESAESE